MRARFRAYVYVWVSVCVCVCVCVGVQEQFSVRLKYSAVKASTWDEDRIAFLQFTTATLC
jgi:DsbC/DsbD-like thiol-disulfide interchange protein